MSLYSGARMGELCQLLVGNVQKLKSHWVFRITLEDDPTKHLKNKGSQRIVPIHPMLIKLGILDFHKRQKLENVKWFFPEIQPDSRDNRAGRYSDFYGDYLRHINVKTDRRVNFHSFRHSFVDALRNAGHLDNEFAFLIGHTQKNVTGRYGMVQEGDLLRRVKLVKSVTYTRVKNYLFLLTAFVYMKISHFRLVCCCRSSFNVSDETNLLKMPPMTASLLLGK